MSVEQLAPLSIEEIRRELASYEEQYQVSTSTFLEKDGCIPGIDEDDAVEWLYRVEQLRVLQEPKVVSPYARSVDASPLKGCMDVIEVLDRLAA